MESRIKIVAARREDAESIGRAVTMAIGEELAEELAGPNHTAADVERMFSSLAVRSDAQYSYLNSFVALDSEGNVVGAVVVYDGANLHRLREAFISEAKEAIGLEYDEDWPDETDSEEFYLDSLAVFEGYRGKGIAHRLIEAAAELAKVSGKPLGLLVSKSNDRARRLYESLGFKCIGERPFAGEVMYHMRRE